MTLVPPSSHGIGGLIPGWTEDTANPANVNTHGGSIDMGTTGVLTTSAIKSEASFNIAVQPNDTTTNDDPGGFVSIVGGTGHGAGNGGAASVGGGTAPGSGTGGNGSISGGAGGANAQGGSVVSFGGAGTTGGDTWVLAGTGSVTNGATRLKDTALNDLIVIGETVNTLGFFGATPHVQPAVSGALSTVTDAAAKAVLTSIIAALVALGLATDSTT